MEVRGRLHAEGSDGGRSNVIPTVCGALPAGQAAC